VKSGAALEVKVDYDVKGGSVRVDLRNTGTTAIEAVLVANAASPAAWKTARI
jgi:hypothetical protein